MTAPSCLRCGTVSLAVVGPTDGGVTFYECPACRRQYALRPGKGLTFRWPHPIGLALYGVQFDESPSGRAAEAVASFTQGRPTDELDWLVTEINLELREPTQQVRDILDCRAQETELREYLRLFVDGVERSLVDSPDRPS
ncbi:MAG TPA: hypothetical protein VKD90_10720 [Gemmataceae bacterium]|nr:hypothetical protein [Gemmataceae bacterium]